MSILEKIVTVGFPPDQYYREFTEKSQIVLHHTVSGKGVEGDVAWWLSDKKRIATAIIVDREGIPWQCFSSRFWGHHLGIKPKVFTDNGVPLVYRTSEKGKLYVANNEILNERSIGIELDSWGPLLRTGNGKWYPVRWDAKKKKFVPNTFTAPIPEDNVQVYPEKFRGFEGFEKYTRPQLETVGQLCQYWNRQYSISMAYNDSMWDVSKLALQGFPGIWSHVSYRGDKSDPHPQPELVSMLKRL